MPDIVANDQQEYAPSVINTPVEDTPEYQLARLEAKINHIGAQVNWVVDTVKALMAGIEASPMGRMINNGR